MVAQPEHPARIPISPDTALVLFSGGQDSTVCLAWALERFARVETIGFDYGQRHAVELAVRPRLRERLARAAARLGRRGSARTTCVELDALAAISETALTRDMRSRSPTAGLPTTFVPGRNLIFLAFAGALAYRRGAKHLVAGMCETDYSGYPDCRDDTIKAMQVALDARHGPPLRAAYAADVDRQGGRPSRWRSEIGGEALLDLVVEETHSCYLGDRTHRHAWGYGCGACPACKLRAEGFARFVQGQRS